MKQWLPILARIATLSAVVVFIVLVAGCGRPAVSTGHNLEVVVCGHAKTESSTQATIKSTGEAVNLYSDAIVDGTDFDYIKIGNDQSEQPCIYLSVNRAAGEKIAAARSDKNSKQIVITVDGMPEIALPKPNSNSNKFVIAEDLTESEISRLYTVITGYND